MTTTNNSIPATTATLAGRIKATFRAWRERRSAAQAADRTRELDGRFEIRERDGRLFLTCEGTAFQEIDPAMQAGSVCELLRAARLDARAYANINR